MADIIIGIDVVGEEKLSRLENQIEDVSLATNTLSSNMGRVGSSAALMSSAADQGGGSMNNFGYKANFASMQIQDMAVQLQGGQDAMVVFSQQGSQLSQLLPGLAGGISGIALVVGTSLVRALMAANAEMKSFADQATEFGGTLGDLIESTDAFTDSLEENTEAVQARRYRQMQDALAEAEQGIEDLVTSSSRDLLRSAQVEGTARAGSGFATGGAFAMFLPEQYRRNMTEESRQIEREARDAAAALADLFTAVDLNNMESLNDAVIEGEKFLESFGDATKLTDAQIQALNDTIEKFIERYEQLEELGNLATPGSGGAIDALFSGGGGFGGGPGAGQGYSVAIDHETGEVSRTVFDLTQPFGGIGNAGAMKPTLAQYRPAAIPFGIQSEYGIDAEGYDLQTGEYVGDLFGMGEGYVSRRYNTPSYQAPGATRHRVSPHEQSLYGVDAQGFDIRTGEYVGDLFGLGDTPPGISMSQQMEYGIDAEGYDLETGEYVGDLFGMGPGSSYRSFNIPKSHPQFMGPIYNGATDGIELRSGRRGGMTGVSQINYMGPQSEQMLDIVSMLNAEEERLTQVINERSRATTDAANTGVDGNRSLLDSNLEIVRSIQDTIVEEERLAEAREQAQQAGQAMSRTIVGGLKDVIFGTKDAGDAFRDMALSIIEQLMDIMIFQPLMNNLTTGLAGAMGGGMGGGGGLFGGLFGAANGAAFSGGNVIPFANGGVVTGPTLFGMSGNQTGLMGEAGPEAILPLTRGANGKLGVEASGQGVVIHQHFSFTANGDESVKKIIAAEAPKIAKYTEAEIIKSRHKGGAMKRAFG